MAFSTFSKEFTANMYTTVENQFITKYLPQATGDAVRVYLYGLYLCRCGEDFDAASCAKLLKISPEQLTEIFGFWEECDLVRILSRDPLFVEYLPVNAAIGKPKPIRAEKYAEFNKELYKQLQKAGKDFKPYEMQRILEFLENNPMEPQALLLISEYCAKKDGAKLSASHILNKAKKLCGEHKFTYEQVERELADFHSHERELSKLFALLGIYRKPQESDYSFLDKWREAGIEFSALCACAATLKKGSLASLDLMAEELRERNLFTEAETKEYLARREELADLVFLVARKLGVKVQNPRAYMEEYAVRWTERGYDKTSLSVLASFAFKLRYDFSEFDALLDSLYAEGIVDEGSVREYCANRERQLKLLQSLQSVCGAVKKTQSALDMIRAWKSWNFSDSMILEAAKRSATAAVPLSYMNKLLSEWKRSGVFSAEQIPERAPASNASQSRSESAVAADKKSDRERHYAILRQKAEAYAERARAEAEKDERFRSADAALKKAEVDLARAEVFDPASLSAIQSRIFALKATRSEALQRLNMTEEDLLPKYSCKKCSDTGFLPDGRLCDCYPISEQS